MKLYTSKLWPGCVLFLLHSFASGLNAQADTLLLSFTHPVYQDLHDQDTLRLDCHGVALVGVNDVAVEGNCSDVELTFQESAYVLPEPVNGLLSVMSCTFTASDDCNQIGTLTVHVAIHDQTPPLLQDVPDDITLEINAPIPFPAVVYAIDNCTRNMTVEYSEQIISTDVDERYIRTWWAIDEAGNKAEAQQLILRPKQVNDETPATPCVDFKPFFTEDIAYTTENCAQVELVCLGSGSSKDLTFKLNGDQTIGIESCATFDVTVYDISALLGTTDEGPFEVSWKVGEGAYRERIADKIALIEFLEAVETGTTWTFEQETNTIYSATNPRFGTLTATSASTRQTRTAPAVRAEREDGLALGLLPGIHRVVAKNQAGCKDSIDVSIECERVTEVYISAVQGLRGQYCLPLDGKKADYTYQYLEEETAPYVEVSPVHQGCIYFDALVPGKASVLVEYCHQPTNTCKKLRLMLEVFSKENVKPPSAVNDLYPVSYNGQRMMEVLLNDEIVGEVTTLTVDEAVTKGDIRVDALNRLHYRAPADWCGNDRIEYEVCNTGGCDTASVTVQVTCEDLLVFNGFSPNGDGMNDHFLILGIEKYPNHQLMIFNTNGHEVYNTTSYSNDWNGTYQGTPLLDGTYYYVLIVEGRAPDSGYVQIRR